MPNEIIALGVFCLAGSIGQVGTIQGIVGLVEYSDDYDNLVAMLPD